MRHRKSCLAAVGLGTALACTGLGLAAAVPSGAVTSVPAFASVPLSSSLAGAPEVAAGTAAAGSTVVLFQEPPQSVFKAHESFALTPLSRSTVTNGTWQLRMPATALKAGVANYEVMKFTPTGAFVTFFGESNAATPAMKSLTQWKAVARSATVSPAMKAAVAIPDSCGGLFMKGLGEQKTLIGETFSSDGRARENFTYSVNANSSLGVAVSDTENSGYSQSGTETSSAGGSDAFNAVYGAVNEYYDTYYGHDLYYESCYIAPGVYDSYYTTHNTGWTTGAAEYSVSSPPYNAQVCSPEPPAGIKVYVNRSAAITWSNGFVVEGIGLSAQSGYTTQVESESTWPANSNKTWYNRNRGVHNYPLLNGSIIAVARGV
jgi:hypothetical protein